MSQHIIDTNAAVEAARHADDAVLHHMSRNPSVEFYEAFYRGHHVPRVEVYKFPADDDGRQVYPSMHLAGRGSPPATEIVVEHDGPWRWELVLDGRWSYDFASAEEVERLIPILADAMAVAAGYACHGSNNRLNPHGPTILGAHQDQPDGEVRVG